MLDADRGRLEALGQVGRQVVGDLLVEAALEAVLGAVAEEAQRVVGDRGAVLELAGVVGLDQVEGLAPGAAGQRAQALASLGDEHLVGVEVHEPVAGGRLERDVAGVGEGAGPLALDHRRAEGACAISTVRSVEPVSTIDDLVDAAPTAARQRGSISSSSRTIMQRLRRQARGGLARRAARLRAGGERRGRGGCSGRAPAAARCGGGLELGEVALDVRQRGVEALRGLEERVRGLEAPSS